MRDPQKKSRTSESRFEKGPLVDIYETYQSYTNKEHSNVNECRSLTTNIVFGFIPENAKTQARPVELRRRISFRM
jgi:hypothetical protein